MKPLPSTGLAAAALFLGVTSCHFPTAADLDLSLGARFLKASGRDLRDHSGTGQVVTLRGTNVGGWLVQERWMNPTDAPDQKTMLATFTRRFGAAVRDELVDIYEDHYFTEADFDRCRDLGMTVLRLPFTWYHLVDDTGALKAGAWVRLDWFVAQAKARGLWVILDLHGAPGSQNGADHSGDTSGAHLFDSASNQTKTVWLWTQVARHFRGEAAVAGYDLLNEPTNGSGGLTGRTQWNFYDRLYQAIREVDPDHLIILESCWEPSHLPAPAEYGWTNVCYEYHNYCWGNDNNGAAQKAFTDGKVAGVRSAAYDVPTLVGEFMLFNAPEAWQYALSKYNAEGWSWTTWSYKVTGTQNNWGLMNHNPPQVHIETDTADEIRAKWTQVGTSAANVGLTNAVRTALN